MWRSSAWMPSTIGFETNSKRVDLPGFFVLGRASVHGSDYFHAVVCGAAADVYLSVTAA